MKKVLIITGTLQFGGVERLVVDTAKALQKTGAYEPIVCALSNRGELIAELKNVGVEYVSLNENPPFKKVFKALLGMRKIIKDTRPDIIHTHQFASDIYGSVGALGLAIPVVSHLHNPYLESRSKRILRYIINRFLVDAVIATVEEKTKSRKHFPQSAKFFILHNAIDPDNIKLAKDFKKADLRRTLDFPAKNLIIGSVGRLAWEKGYDLLISAFERVLGSIPHCSLLLVGDGPEREKLQKLALDRGIADRVIFTGYRKDVAELISIFDICVVSSRLESFSLAALEAMFMNVPVLITDRLSSKDIFAPAVSVAPPSIQGLTDGIVALLQDEARRRELGTKGKKLVEEQFTMDRYIEKLQGIYDTIIQLP